MSSFRSTTTFLAGIQWLFFIFANTVVIPLSVGAAFALPPEEITASLQRSFVYTGIACILQVLLGHRYPILEGQSGLWWGVILSLTASASASSLDLAQLGGSLAIGIVLSGATIMVLSFFGFATFLRKIFTPITMSVYLLLLSVQLIQIFFKGMLGLSADGHINIPVSLLSIFLVLLVALLHLKGSKTVSNFSILIGILVGWVLYELFLPAADRPPAVAAVESASLFTLFPWGSPSLLGGVIATAFLTGMVNTTNTVASLRGAEHVFDSVSHNRQYRGSLLVSGANTVVAGLFGLVPYCPYTSSLGFLQTTRILERAPFVLGSILFILLGVFEPLGSFLASMPVSIGYAVLFVAYLQLFGSALRNIDGISFNPKTIYRLAAPCLFGIAVLNIPVAAFSSLPALARPLLGNGLLLGVILSVFMENLIQWDRFELTEHPGQLEEMRE